MSTPASTTWRTIRWAASSSQLRGSWFEQAGTILPSLEALPSFTWDGYGIEYLAGVERTHVQSEALYGVGYDVDTRTLEIEFTSGAIYRYYDVPDHLYIGLMTAESHGEFYANFIRNAGFDFEQLA